MLFEGVNRFERQRASSIKSKAVKLTARSTDDAA